jgi:hypothetical protein
MRSFGVCSASGVKISYAAQICAMNVIHHQTMAQCSVFVQMIFELPFRLPYWISEVVEGILATRQLDHGQSLHTKNNSKRVIVLIRLLIYRYLGTRFKCLLPVILTLRAVQGRKFRCSNKKLTFLNKQWFFFFVQPVPRLEISHHVRLRGSWKRKWNRHTNEA